MNDASMNMGVQLSLGDQVTLFNRCAGNSDTSLSASQIDFKDKVAKVRDDL